MRVDQRQALATLTKPRLLELAAAFELVVPAAALKDDVVDVLARSRRASFERILESLLRDELKAVCRAAGLDDSGREKAAIADRILGREPPEKSPLAPLSQRGGAEGSPPETRQLALDVPVSGPAAKKRARKTGKPANGATLGFEEKLWTAADKLRNNLDAAEHKHVVLGLIFLKYISDAFEEIHERLLSEVDAGADPSTILSRWRTRRFEKGRDVADTRTLRSEGVKTTRTRARMGSRLHMHEGFALEGATQALLKIRYPDDRGLL